MVRSRARLVRGELRNAEEISDSPCTGFVYQWIAWVERTEILAESSETVDQTIGDGETNGQIRYMSSRRQMAATEGWQSSRRFETLIIDHGCDEPNQPRCRSRGRSRALKNWKITCGRFKRPGSTSRSS